jgi:hypothetical protein
VRQGSVQANRGASTRRLRLPGPGAIGAPDEHASSRILRRSSRNVDTTRFRANFLFLNRLNLRIRKFLEPPYPVESVLSFPHGSRRTPLAFKQTVLSMPAHIWEATSEAPPRGSRKSGRDESTARVQAIQQSDWCRGENRSRDFCHRRYVRQLASGDHLELLTGYEIRELALGPDQVTNEAFDDGQLVVKASALVESNHDGATRSALRTLLVAVTVAGSPTKISVARWNSSGREPRTGLLDCHRIIHQTEHSQ